MLETLDHLATRIGQLVTRTQALAAERDALRNRAESADKHAQNLDARSEQAESDLRTARAQLAACEQTLADEQHRARQVEADLRTQLERQTRELQALAARFDANQRALQRLRDVSAQTRTRIDAVLERLPGFTAAAAPGEASS